MELAASKGWREVLQPYLVSKRDSSFPDPASFKVEKEFMYAAMTASLFKKVIGELLHHIEIEVPVAVKGLIEKEKNEEKKFDIGK